MNTLFFLLVFYFIFLPFQFALSPFTGVDLAVIRLFTIGIFFFWLAISLIRKRIFVPKPLLFFFPLSFLFVISLSFFWAEQSIYVLRKGAFLFSFFPLFFVLLSVILENPGIRQRLVSAYLAGATLLASCALILFSTQFLFGIDQVLVFLTRTIFPIFLGDTFAQAVATYPSLLVNLSGATALRATGPFPDPHMFAFYLGLSFPIALLSLFSAKSQKWQVLYGGATVLVFLALLLSFSRGAYAGLFLAGTIFLMQVKIKDWSKKKKWMTALILLLLFGGAVWSGAGARFLSSFSEKDGSNQERLRLWSEAVGHITERPFLGVGLGNYPFLVDPRASYRDPIYAHSLYLDIAVELGLLGLLAFLGLLFLALFSSWRLWQSENNKQAQAVFLALVIFSGHSLFETALFSVHVLPALLLFLALGVSYKYEKNPVA